ncbi:MAG TPA: FUSC family protein [Solirubrobacteraceae bacterium]
MLRERTAPMLEEAASRISWRSRVRRVRVRWRVLVQAAFAAAVAWEIATQVWGHPAPFFAPVSAIIALGQSYVQRGRRAVELVIGVSLGIALADVLITELGIGVLQLALVVFLAMGTALLFTPSQLFINQAAVSAALVATIQPPTQGITFARSIDALTGGTVALLTAALLFPADPLRLMRDAASPVLEELAAVLEDVAEALRRRDRDRAEAAVERARGVDELEGRLAGAVTESRETIRYAPPRRRARSAVAVYAEAAAQIDLAVRNVRVLARGAIRALMLEDSVPEELCRALEELAGAVRALAPALERGRGLEDVRARAVRAAVAATVVLERTGNLSVSVLVGQVRSTATDLLTGSGMPYEEAAEAVREAARAGVEAEAASSG